MVVAGVGGGRGGGGGGGVVVVVVVQAPTSPQLRTSSFCNTVLLRDHVEVAPNPDPTCIVLPVAISGLSLRTRFIQA